MGDKEKPNMLPLFWKWSQRTGNDDDQTGSQNRQGNPDGFTSESRILDIERAKRASLIQQANRLYTVGKAQQDAVLERLGLSRQDVTQPSPQPPAASRRNPQKRRTISPLLDVPHLNTEHLNRNQRNLESLDEEDESFWDKVLLGSQVAAYACKEAQMAERSPTPSISSVYSLSSVDADTPRELRAIALIRRPVEVTPLSPTPVVVPLAPTPPTVPQSKKKISRPGIFLRPAKAVSAAGKTTSGCSLGTVKAKRDELQLLSDPVKSLSLSFQLLSSDFWTKKIEGLKILQVLTRHNPETLKTQLHKVCLVLIEEVKNLRSAVSCEAVKTLGDLYRHLHKTMDPEVEGTGRALLLKLAEKSAFIHEQVNLALDAMVENCSYGRTVSVLLSTGLSHRCVAVRGSMAQHLHQLADSLGAAYILTTGRCFTQRFLTAVSKMSVDAAPEVRHHGKIILQELALHKDFLSIWTKIIPEKDRRPLFKLLKAKK